MVMGRRLFTKAVAAAMTTVFPQPQRPDQVYNPGATGVAPGSHSGILRATKVIVIGAKGGVFVYSPSAAAGNLVDSIAAQAGTDTYGNHYLAGTATYNNAGGIAAALSNSSLLFYAGSESAGWTLKSELTGDSAGDLQLSPTTGRQVTIENGLTGFTGPLFLVQGLTAIDMPSVGTALEVEVTGDADFRFTLSESGEMQWGSGASAADTIVARAGAGLLSVPTLTTDSWHSLSSLYNAGFGDGSPASFYRHEPQGSSSAVVRLQGTFVLTANEASGTAVLTLPAGYVPAQAQRFFSVSNLSGASLTAATLTLSTAGVLALGVAGTNGDFVQLDGITFPTDN